MQHAEEFSDTNAEHEVNFVQSSFAVCHISCIQAWGMEGYQTVSSQARCGKIVSWFGTKRGPHGGHAGHEEVEGNQLIAAVVQLHGQLLFRRLDVLLRAVQAVGQVVDLRPRHSTMLSNLTRSASLAICVKLPRTEVQG